MTTCDICSLSWIILIASVSSVLDSDCRLNCVSRCTRWWMRCSWQERSGRPVRQRSSSSSSCSSHSSKKYINKKIKSQQPFSLPGHKSAALAPKTSCSLFLSLWNGHSSCSCLSRANIFQDFKGSGLQMINIVYIWMWVQLIFCLSVAIFCTRLTAKDVIEYESYTAHFTMLTFHILP